MDFSGAVSGIVMAIAGVVITGITSIGGFFINKAFHQIKMKSLVSEINKYVTWVAQAGTFQPLDLTEKKQTILQQVMVYASENGINISDAQLAILIDVSFKSILQLESLGMRKVNYKFEKGEK